MDFDAVQLDMQLGVNPNGRSDKVEAPIGRIAPEAVPRKQQREACTFVDRHGRLLLWYLPDVVSTKMLVSVLSSSLVPTSQTVMQDTVGSALERHSKAIMQAPGTKKSAWRTHEEIFDMSSGEHFTPGTFFLSPYRRTSGHEVRKEQ
jgi:hypothetical protein